MAATPAGRIVLVLVLALFLVADVAPAWASHAPKRNGSLKIDGASLTYTVWRRGQGIRYTVHLKDTKRDGHAVYVEIKMNMNDASDPNDKIRNGTGAGNTLTRTRNRVATNVPGFGRIGTHFQSVEFKLCVEHKPRWGPDYQKDPCVKSGRLGLHSQFLHSGKFRANAIWFMQTSMSNFQHWKARRPTQWGNFNWTDDKDTGKTTACSAPVERVTRRFSRFFDDACERHDFGYRNFGHISGLQLAPRDDWRAWIDREFLGDMHQACNRLPAYQQKGCKVAANKYYSAVRNFGGFAFYGR